jgi:hypothetical protein
MKALLNTAVGITCYVLSSAAMADTVNPLDAERWNTRPLVIVVPGPEDRLLKSLNEQLQKPENREAFLDREMVLYRVVDGRATRNDKPLPPDQARALLDALEAQSDGPATVFLVGKDGGVKVREQGEVNARDLFSTIDRMPMRR